MLRELDPSIRFVIARLVGADADDVLQAAYLKAFRSWGSFRGEAAPSTWLHRIAYTTAIDHLRRQQRRPVATQPPERLADLPCGDDPTSGLADRVDLAAALGNLSVEHRAVVLLVDGQGRSHAEAAEILGVPSGTIASRVHRARLALRAALTVGSET